MCACMCVCKRVFIFVCVCVFICMCVRVCAYVCLCSKKKLQKKAHTQKKGAFSSMSCATPQMSSANISSDSHTQWAVNLGGSQRFALPLESCCEK